MMKNYPPNEHFVVVLFLLAVFGPVVARSEQLRLEASVDSMGSNYSLVLYGADRAKLEAASEEAFDEVRRLDRLLSNYRPESEWSLVNRNAAEGPVKVSAELFQLLSACVEYSRQSEGAFDISVGPLMKVWGFYKGSGHMPRLQEVREALAKVGYRIILLDASNRTVRFAVKGVELDPGGIGKGYAVDRMVDVLRRDGVESALVSASGSSIYALGAPPGEAGWKIRIRDPKDETKTVTEVTLKNESMSTSGNYEKFFWAEGKMYSHIMDPRTGYPSRGMLSASVITPLTLDSEAWTKPFYINGREWAAKHKPKGFRVFLCPDTSESGTEQSCAWLQ
jgi:thiamine biosynthesis lipoprotein